MEKAIVMIYPSDPSKLNEPGNIVLAGHNYGDGKLFANNKNLKNGDKIIISDEKGRTITYEVYDKFTTDPSDTEYMSRSTNGKREISLSTCTDDEVNRTIVLAREVQE